MPSRDLVEKCKAAAKAARDARIEAPLSRCYGVIVDAILSVVADELRVPTDAMCAAHIQTDWPEGHKMPDRETARSEWTAMFSASALMKDDAQ